MIKFYKNLQNTRGLANAAQVIAGDISFGPVLEKCSVFLACRFVVQNRTYCIFFLCHKIV